MAAASSGVVVVLVLKSVPILKYQPVRPESRAANVGRSSSEAITVLRNANRSASRSFWPKDVVTAQEYPSDSARELTSFDVLP